MKKILYFLSFFGSLSTLFCCALPVVLVSLGMGAVFASLTSFIPQIYWIAEYKIWLFLVTGGLLILSWIFMEQSKVMECPIDENKRQMCKNSKSIAQKVFWCSTFLYSIGLVFSYVVPLAIQYLQL